MGTQSEPPPPLTPHEEEMIRKLDPLGHDELLRRLKADLQTAVEIELATIPIYLYAYYSIQRNAYSGENIRPIDLFANKAGSMIMSVAVEEMLHMSLSSNILYSLGADPVLYGKSPDPYPTGLPYHNPVGPPGPDRDTKVLIPLSKFGYEQLWHFLQIEYPEAVDAWPEDCNWDTIGQFYSYIRCLICCPSITDEDFNARGPESYKEQIQPDNYSPNNIDTVYPAERFDPWGFPPRHGAAGVADFSNQPDSGQLRTVASKTDALAAIDTICDQGEGYAHGSTDDPSGKEDSHYFKFLKLQAQLERYKHHREKLAPLPKPPDPQLPTISDADLAEVIVNFPDNPITRPVGRIGDSYVYPERFRALSDLCNGMYQYMFIMTETIFKIPAGTPVPGTPTEQKVFFNKGMHRSMIWVLDKLIQAMRNFDLGDGHMLAPTFENYDLGHPEDAYRNLLNLTDAITDCDQLSAVGYIIETIKTLPDVSTYWEESK